MRTVQRMLHSQHKSKLNTFIGFWESRGYVGFMCGLIVSIFWGTAVAQEKNEWPNIHGIHRNKKSAETGMLKQWPETGPELLWTVTGLGEGYSTVSIAGGYIFAAGMIETLFTQGSLIGLPIWLNNFTCASITSP